MSKNKNSRKIVVRNRSAALRSREDRRGNLRTETYRRDEESVAVAISTDPRNDSTRVFIDNLNGESYRFDGRTARTLYRALQKHYQFTEKSDRKSTRLNSSHVSESRMPSSA